MLLRILYARKKGAFFFGSQRDTAFSRFVGEWMDHLPAKSVTNKPGSAGFFFLKDFRGNCMKRTFDNIRFLERGEGLGERAQTGVSLHCHTLHSKEMLDFVPYYAMRIPIASYFWRRYVKHSEKLIGGSIDFTKGHWTPPLTAQEVFKAEKENLSNLGLDTIVSITDHDSINANLELRREKKTAECPISMEWTVPFEEGFFHLGVHNLPIEKAAAMTEELLAYTHSRSKPDNERLRLLFEMLNEIPDILIVLNHPIWDIEMIGQHAHELLLERFVAIHAKWIHAIEINGFRSWAENVAAAELAESLNIPVISGGDRHCLQNNTMVNVTNAASFGEFADEIRNDRHSQIAVMDEYNAPLPSRQLRSIAQILGRYPSFPKDRRNWTDRVHLNYGDDTGLKTLTEHWKGRTPGWTYPVFFALSVLAHPAIQPLIALTVGDTDIGRNDTKPPVENAVQPALQTFKTSSVKS